MTRLLAALLLVSGFAHAEEKRPATVKLEGQISNYTALEFVSSMEKAAKEASRITVRINTPGGSVYASYQIAQAIEAAAQSVPVKCVVDGVALSGGFYVLQSCPVRLMTARSILMSHDPRYGDLGDADLRQLRLLTTALEYLSRAMAAHCVARLKIDAAEYVRRVSDTEWWISATEALEVGAVDSLLPSPNAKATP